MANYCIDYIYQDGSYVDYGTFIESSEEERNKTLGELGQDKRYTITDIYENEDCYCYARSEGECACGNFK